MERDTAKNFKMPSHFCYNESFIPLNRNRFFFFFTLGTRQQQQQ